MKALGGIILWVSFRAGKKKLELFLFVIFPASTTNFFDRWNYKNNKVSCLWLDFLSFCKWKKKLYAWNYRVPASFFGSRVNGTIFPFLEIEVLCFFLKVPADLYIKDWQLEKIGLCLKCKESWRKRSLTWREKNKLTSKNKCFMCFY